MLISFDPIGRFRPNFFKSLCKSKGHPPKRVLSMLFKPVKHCKQKSTKLGVSGDRKSRLWENFFQNF